MTVCASSSRLPGFYNLNIAERRELLSQNSSLSHDEITILCGETSLSLDQANHMVENVVGLYPLPLGIALNFIVNGREVLVPMIIEEPSVIAGASFMAKLTRSAGGFWAHSSPPPRSDRPYQF